MKTAIICAGFHRSGTSLAGQMLHQAQIPMALKLLHGNVANPDGYFEDLVAIHMHERLLESVNSNWMFHGEVELTQDSSIVSDELKKYIKKRADVCKDIWSVKDPRASLFLPAWQTALNNTGRFVLMYRHWSLCLQSMYKRHSRWIAHKLLSGKKLEKHIIFWKEPELAAKMWLAYNKAIVKFVKSSPNNTLLISHAALLEEFDLIDAINRKFSLSIKQLNKSPVKKEYSLESVDNLTFEHLPLDLVNELDSIYKQLCELSHAPQIGLMPIVNKLTVNQTNIVSMIHQLNNNPYKLGKESVSKSDENNYINNVEKKATPENVNLWLKTHFSSYSKLPAINSFMINILSHWSSLSLLHEDSLIYLAKILEKE